MPHYAGWQTAVPRVPPVRGSAPRTPSMASESRHGFQIGGDSLRPTDATGWIGWFSRCPSRRRPAHRRRGSPPAPTARLRRSTRWTSRRTSVHSRFRNPRSALSAPVRRTPVPPPRNTCCPAKAWDTCVPPGGTPCSGRCPRARSASSGRSVRDVSPPGPAVRASSGRIPGR